MCCTIDDLQQSPVKSNGPSQYGWKTKCKTT